jgi:hypothetical protein
VLGRLSDLVSPAATAALRLHEGPAADDHVRSHAAQAVTVGHDISFPQGHLQPQEDAGFALLAHEAAHVMQYLLPNPAWRRATQAGIAEQEREAAAVEQNALYLARHKVVPAAEVAPTPGPAPAPLSSPSSARRQPAPPPATALPGQAAPVPFPTSSQPAPLSAPASASAALKPLAATANREPAAAPVPQPPNMEALREQLFRDLLARIKSDSERGA